jgi:hypothetical protein
MLSKITKINKESLTTKLTLLIVGLTAGSALLVPATYASFHPVTSGEIADNTIQSVDIRNGQVGSVDIGNRQVAAIDLADNAIKPTVSFVFGDGVVVPANSAGAADDVSCPAGQIRTGGGYWIDNTSTTATVVRNYPAGNGWVVEANNLGNSEGKLFAYAVCMAPFP